MNYLDVVGDMGGVCKLATCYFLCYSVTCSFVGLGCPRVLRSDYGTENSRVATAQIAFRSNGDDDLAGDRSFRYGKSTTNTVCVVI